MGHSTLREINELNFEDEVLAAPVPFLLDFTATWCPPCRVLTPILVKIADTYGPRLRVGTVDAEANPRLASQFGIRGMPTLVTFVGGKERARHLGAAPAHVVVALFEDWLSPSPPTQS
jgi:thioredoxin 1